MFVGCKPKLKEDTKTDRNTAVNEITVFPEGSPEARGQVLFTRRSYLLQSVLQPDAFKPEGYENLQMDSSLAKTLTSEELDDIVAYLLTLK